MKKPRKTYGEGAMEQEYHDFLDRSGLSLSDLPENLHSLLRAFFCGGAHMVADRALSERVSFVPTYLASVARDTGKFLEFENDDKKNQ